MISAGRDGELAFTRKARGDGFLVSTNFNVANPANGDYPCWRYSLATERLSGIRSTDALDIGTVATIMDAVHVASPAVWTNWTVVADLATRTVNVYYFHQFDRPITLRVDDELARRPADVRLSTMFPAETVARADAAYERLAAVRFRARATGLAWLVVVAASVLLVWIGCTKTPDGRWQWTAAALALGPVAAGAWLAAGRGRDRPTAGPWRDAVWSAARAVPPYAAGTVLALSATLVVPAVRQSVGLQLLAVYGLPLVLGWLYRPVFPVNAGVTALAAEPGPAPRPRLLQTIVTGHLTMAGLWLVVMMAFNRIVQTVGPGRWSMVFAWMLAALGSILGGALVAVYFVASPSPSWRRSWWWVVLSLALLAGGAAAGTALSRWLA